MTHLISDRYADENRQLHEKPGYGSSGHYWLGHVMELCNYADTNDVLDYGCGKGTLKAYGEQAGLIVKNYDPATFPDDPGEGYGVVVCLDVLEHIEPGKLHDVLMDITSRTRKVCFANVSTVPSTKTLSDGKNAHLIQQKWKWWREHFRPVGKVLRIRQVPGSFSVVWTPWKNTLTSEQRQLIKTGDPSCTPSS